MWMAAVLAGGPGAVLSHRSAAMLWGSAERIGRRSRSPRPGLAAGARGSSDPRPETNAHIYAEARWFEIDCLWRPQRLALELDGRATHSTRAAFENDRLRDRTLQVAGFRTIRLTWRHLHDSPAAVDKDLRA
jgi:hypothetical protein